MARFTEGNFYYIEKNVYKPSVFTNTVFYVKDLYLDGKTIRAEGPKLFSHSFTGGTYIGGTENVIPSAYNKQQDKYKIVTREKALLLLFDQIFGENKFIILNKIMF